MTARPASDEIHHLAGMFAAHRAMNHSVAFDETHREMMTAEPAACLKGCYYQASAGGGSDHENGKNASTTRDKIRADGTGPVEHAGPIDIDRPMAGIPSVCAGSARSAFIQTVVQAGWAMKARDKDETGEAERRSAPCWRF
ncbi:MAG: hypothetical protein ACLR4Z_02210 [Butyricicoccaceae bacterium]